MPTSEDPLSFEHVPCPFCGLLCDDLRVRVADGTVELLDGGCPRSQSGFTVAGDGAPRIAGDAASLDEAVRRAGELLGTARRPVVGGLGTDVAGMRAVLALSDGIGAALDHVHGDSLHANLRVLQDRGWITTTLGEVRNRADLVVVLGSDLFDAFPRLIERVIAPSSAMQAEALQARRLVVLGGPADWSAPATDVPVHYQPAAMEDLAELLSALRCLINERPLQADTPAGPTLDALRPLAEQMSQASYGVLIWSTPSLAGTHKDLTVQCATGLIEDLNRERRFAGLPLALGDGDMSAYQVCTWQTGYPLRVDLAGGFPRYDPYHLSTARSLADGADALLWISAFNPTHGPPDTQVPTVVLGRPDLQFPHQPEVFIPVGIPGLDHGGTAFRGDAVVSLPLRALRSTSLPSVAAVAQAISERITSTEAPC